MREFWMVEAAYPFSSSFTVGGFECRMAPGGPTHFCPVFTSREEAEKWAGGRHPIIRLCSVLETSDTEH